MGCWLLYFRLYSENYAEIIHAVSRLYFVCIAAVFLQEGRAGRLGFVNRIDVRKRRVGPVECGAGCLLG